MTTATAKKNYRKPNESIIIHSGVSRQVVVKGCPNCGKDLKGTLCQTTRTRFKCPSCGVSIENTNENRCRVCYTLCSDSETYNAHVRGGCPFAGLPYPGTEVLRDCEKGVRV